MYNCGLSHILSIQMSDCNCWFAPRLLDGSKMHFKRLSKGLKEMQLTVAVVELGSSFIANNNISLIQISYMLMIKHLSL